MADFTHPSLVWGPCSGGPHQNFSMKLIPHKLGMGLLYGENYIILTSKTFDWSTRVTDRQTDGIAMAYTCTRYSIYAVAHKKSTSSHQNRSRGRKSRSSSSCNQRWCFRSSGSSSTVGNCHQWRSISFRRRQCFRCFNVRFNLMWKMHKHL